MRRKGQKLVTYTEIPYTYTYNPHFEDLTVPQPWRRRPDADEIYFLPLDFVMMFTDRGRMSHIRHREAAYIAELSQSMLTEGILTPLEMNLDREGKIRLHEGHHRIIVANNLQHYFPRVPVKLKRVDGVLRQYGKQLTEAIDDIFRYINRDRFYTSEG